MRRILPALGVAVVYLGLVPGARAVLPTAQQITDKANQARPVATSSDVLYFIHRGDAPPREAVRVRTRPPGDVRLDLQDLRTGQRETRLWGVSAQGDRPPPPAWVRWYAGHEFSSLVLDIKADPGRTSLAHLGGTILWVLGAGPREPDSPQVHVERETGHLRRTVQRIAVTDGPRIHRVDLPAPETAPPGEAPPAQSPWPQQIQVREGKESATWRLKSQRWPATPTDADFQLESSHPKTPPVAETADARHPRTSLGARRSRWLRLGNHWPFGQWLWDERWHRTSTASARSGVSGWELESPESP